MNLHICFSSRQTRPNFWNICKIALKWNFKIEFIRIEKEKQVCSWCIQIYRENKYFPVLHQKMECNTFFMANTSQGFDKQKKMFL